MLEKLNGRLRFWTILAAGAVFIVTTTVTVENRYAKASEVKQVQEAANTILAVLRIQNVARKAVLDLKDAQGTITPAERVELKGLIQILATLPK